MGKLMSLKREHDGAAIRVPKMAITNLAPLEGKPGTRITTTSGVVDVEQDIGTVSALFEAD